MMDLTDRVERGMYDTVDVIDANGEERTVYGQVRVRREHEVRADGSRETWTIGLLEGDGSTHEPPAAVSTQLADELHHAFGIDVRENERVDVIDLTSEEVDLL